MLSPGLRLLTIPSDIPQEQDVWGVMAELLPGQSLERASLSEGLARLAGESFDAVLVDVSKGSWDALDRIRRMSGGAPLIVLGDGDDEALMIDAIRAGADEYVVKSVLSNEALVRALDRAIERRRARTARSPEQGGSLLDALPDELFRIDRDGRCFDVKPAKGADGWSLAGLLGQREGKGVANDEAVTLFKEHLEAALARGATRVFEFQRKSGKEIRYYEVRLVATEATEGVAIVRDITESQSLELKLQQSRRLEAMERVAFGVAHDFNKLLTVISGNVELALAELSGDQPGRQELEEVRDAAERAALLTRQLAAFSGKQILKPVSLDLNALVQAIASVLRRFTGDNIELETRLHRGLGAIRADPVQIEQVLMNLAMNGREAMPKGGKLVFETRSVELQDPYARQVVELPPGAYAMLGVSDTGIGMDADTCSRVFEPFFTTKDRGKRPGLGLSTVYGVVKQSDGYIRVSSEPGIGTAFEIYFPQVDSGTPAEPPKPKRAVQTRGETILLVEDDVNVLQVAHRFLEEGGDKVISTSHIAKALAWVRDPRTSVHLLATDVVMPGMSGRELSEHARAARPGLKTLYISGHTDDAIAHHGVPAPKEAFLEKPYGRQELLDAVRRALDED